MIVGTYFPGDTNKTLQVVQHNLYWGLVGDLFHYAKERYLKAINLVGTETTLSRQIQQREGLDHRVLQQAHDKIAAYYRFAHDNGGQMNLFSDGRTYEEDLAKAWSDFWYSETRSLAEFDAINIAILTAVSYQNTEAGYAAENHLSGLLDQRYGAMRDSTVDGTTLAKETPVPSQSEFNVTKQAGRSKLRFPQVRPELVCKQEQRLPDLATRQEDVSGEENRIPNNTDTTEGNAEGNEDQTGEKVEEEGPLLFDFESEEQTLVDELIGAVRQLLHRKDITPYQIYGIAKLLFALERLPLLTPGVGVMVTLGCHSNDGSSYQDMRLDSDSFCLGTGETVRYHAIGNDSLSSTEFEVGIGWRGDSDWLSVSEWISVFRGRITDTTNTIGIEDYSNDEEIDWYGEIVPETYWSQLDSDYA